jgi:hypothetical protein
VKWGLLSRRDGILGCLLVMVLILLLLPFLFLPPVAGTLTTLGSFDVPMDSTCEVRRSSSMEVLVGSDREERNRSV